MWAVVVWCLFCFTFYLWQLMMCYVHMIMLCFFFFLALGNSTMSSSPPVVGERKSFSNVTRLGFAAGHDSPSLQIQETSGLHNNNMTTDSSGTTGIIFSCNLIYLHGKIWYAIKPKNQAAWLLCSIGLRNGETQSYSNVISRAEANISFNPPKTNDLGKKGKKPNRVLLSTAGGRRYWLLGRQVGNSCIFKRRFQCCCLCSMNYLHFMRLKLLVDR